MRRQRMTTHFKLTISTGDINITKDVTAPKGDYFNSLNKTFINAVREMVTLLENPPKTEDKPVVVKPTKEKKTKNAEDNR